ncbi:MAG: flagellar hook-length control protein FliK, partial [Fibromonadales bacterium]|nr:flagellar hook-length control protein FliK [Fibromonadales bacterium]
MNPISIIPAPVAAEISGAGSFFGSCQIAASGFEDFLQASCANINDTSDSAEGELTEQFLLLLKRFKNNEVLTEEEKAELTSLVDERYLLRHKEEEKKPEADTADTVMRGTEEYIRSLAKEMGIENPEEFAKFKEIVSDLLENGLIAFGDESSFTKEILKELWEKTELPSIPEKAKQEPVEQVEQTEQVELAKLGNEYNPEAMAYINRLALEMGVDREEFSKFYALMFDLMDEELITLQDLKEAVKVLPKAESSPVKLALESIWQSVKNEGDVKREVAIKLAEEKLSIEPKISSELKLEGENSKSIKQSVKQETQLETKLAKPQTTSLPQATPAQPEVKAVWEGGALKIEVVDSKTGEKLQSVQTSGNMQERMHEYEVIRQVVAKAKFITTPTGEQKLTIQLRPEHLGQVDLRIVLNRGEMQIHARVESAVAQQALESHIGLLREGLEKQGIALERLEVSVEQRDRQDAWSLMEKQEQREQKRGNRKHRQGR